MIEINKVQAIKNSSSKLLMKRCFTKSGVKTALWVDPNMCTAQSGKTIIDECDKLGYPIVAKSHFGSRGRGNYLLNTKEELLQWLKGKTVNNYIFEKFYNYNREYRLHVTKNGCFYTCRKVLKNDTPKDKRWYRNDSNSNWIMENNPLFDKPVNWKHIEDECVKALHAVGLDFAAMDVKVQSSLDKKGKPRKEVDFIVIECNSAPSFGEITLEKYKIEIMKLITEKI